MGKSDKPDKKDKKEKGDASEEASGPIRVTYQTPFALSGPDHEEAGRIYKLATMEDCFTFRQFADSLDGFTLRHSKLNDVAVWDKKLPGEPMHVIKVFGLFIRTEEDPDGAVEPEMLYDLLQDPIFRGEWDTYRQEAFRVVLLNDTNDIGYYAAKSPVPMVANRDFVNQRTWHSAGKGEFVIFNTTVQHATTPESYQKEVHKNKNGTYVRATSKVTGYLVRPWYDEKGEVIGSSLTYITQSDPNGWIPTSLTNYIASKFAPNTIKGIREALKKFRVWLPAQMAKGTYEKDWIQPSVWWTDADGKTSTETAPPPNATHDFLRVKWKEEEEKEKAKKKK